MKMLRNEKGWRRGKREEIFERWKEKRVRYGIKCRREGCDVESCVWEKKNGKGNKREPEETRDISKDNNILIN